MKEHTLNLREYALEELTEDAQHRAYSKWKETPDGYNMDATEIVDTLLAFCNLFDVACTDYAFDDCSHEFTFQITTDNLQERSIVKGALYDKKLATYLKNNYARYIQCSDGMDKACPLTGYCFDEDILQPMRDCISGRKPYNCYYDVVNDCLDALFQSAEIECAYRFSEDYFKDDSIANERTYFEDGTPFSLPHLCNQTAELKGSNTL